MNEGYFSLFSPLKSTPSSVRKSWLTPRASNVVFSFYQSLSYISHSPFVITEISYTFKRLLVLFLLTKWFPNKPVNIICYLFSMYKLTLHFTISLEPLDRERIKLIQSGLFLCCNSSDVKRYHNSFPGKGEITEKLSIYIYSHF